MILNEIHRYQGYIHRESQRTVTVVDPYLQVKTERRWQTCVQYYTDGESDKSFAVPVDDFRQRFMTLKEHEAQFAKELEAVSAPPQNPQE